MGTSGNTELGSSWQNSASQDPVPEWRLPIQEDEPPDSDSAIYQKSTKDSYHGNSSSQRTPQKSASNSTTAYSSATEIAGSQHSHVSKVVQPSPHSFQSTHLGHADMEMCSDEDDETIKGSQLDNFAY